MKDALDELPCLLNLLHSDIYLESRGNSSSTTPTTRQSLSWLECISADGVQVSFCSAVRAAAIFQFAFISIKTAFQVAPQQLVQRPPREPPLHRALRLTPLHPVNSHQLRWAHSLTSRPMRPTSAFANSGPPIPRYRKPYKPLLAPRRHPQTRDLCLLQSRPVSKAQHHLFIKVIAHLRPHQSLLPKREVAVGWHQRLDASVSAA